MTKLGISVALLTPFEADGALNLSLLRSHATAVLKQGVNGVTVFGTTGEGASIGFDERSLGLTALFDSGVPVEKTIVGLCGNSVADVAAQVRQALAFGIRDFLLLPPFYFKQPDDNALFDWHAALFAATDPQARFILYHIPQVTQIPLSLDLVGRLRTQFFDRVIAIKDSSGNWDNTKALLQRGSIPVLVGDERLLHKAAAMGAAGSICGMSNLHPARLVRLFTSQTEDKALSAEVDAVVSVPVIPAIKQIMAKRSGNTDWMHIRPPLAPLSGNDFNVIDDYLTQTPTL